MAESTLFDNPRSDRIRAVANLRTRAGRRRTGRILVEGPQAVRELLRFQGRHVLDVYLTDQACSRDGELEDLARETTRWVHAVTDDVAHAISPDCQGVAAVATREAIHNDESGFWPSLSSRPPSFLVCLPQSQDPGNVGTIIRSADAMGAAGVVLGTGTVDPANPKVIRASAGSVFHLPIIHGSLADVVEQTGGSWPLLGTRGDDADLTLDALLDRALCPDQERHDCLLASNHAWVFGNEAHGLSEEDASLCDHLVSIPIVGQAESLNAAAAAAMCVYASHLGLRPGKERTTRP